MNWGALTRDRLLCLSWVVSVAAILVARPTLAAEPWLRHTIDDSSEGADGARLTDANGDGLLDLATPWEEGGLVRVCLNPGPAHATEPWPAVTVGRVASPEDAVLVDLDADGAMDVVSCCEGAVRTVWVHWAPTNPNAYLDSQAWTTQPIPASKGARQWMMCLPLDMDGENGVDLVCGAKGSDAMIGWFRCPEDPRRLEDWTWHPMSPAGWVMSLDAADFDHDGDLDVIVSDRRGPHRGLRWLENPGPGPSQEQPWTSNLIGASDKEVMFMTRGDIDEDGQPDVVTATRDGKLVLLRPKAPDAREAWSVATFPIPESAGTGKGVAVGDLDLDGRPDIVFSCEHANGKLGVMWISEPLSVERRFHDVSGLDGIKFDLVQLIDLDGDGDLDLITCEETTGLGVVWYENPTVEDRVRQPR